MPVAENVSGDEAAPRAAHADGESNGPNGKPGAKRPRALERAPCHNRILNLDKA